MPEQLTPDIRPEIPEKDIREISAEFERHRENPEFRGLTNHELLRQSLRTYTHTAPAPAPSGQVIQNPLTDYAQAAAPETKLEIEHLLSIAVNDGILQANEEAMKSSAFVLDAFHDSLAGRLYPELKKRGKIKD